MHNEWFLIIFKSIVYFWLQFEPFLEVYDKINWNWWFLNMNNNNNNIVFSSLFYSERHISYICVINIHWNICHLISVISIKKKTLNKRQFNKKRYTSTFKTRQGPFLNFCCFWWRCNFNQLVYRSVYKSTLKFNVRQKRINQNNKIG